MGNGHGSGRTDHAGRHIHRPDNLGRKVVQVDDGNIVRRVGCGNVAKTRLLAIVGGDSELRLSADADRERKGRERNEKIDLHRETPIFWGYVSRPRPPRRTGSGKLRF
jgi:hypothetical protein